MIPSVVLLLIVGLCANRVDEVFAKTGDLLSTVILFRHGQRTAIGKFQNLPCLSCRDLGEGQLTKNGSYQMYLLGEHLRAKYSSLFAKDGIFRVSNMQLMSSRFDRCIMSLQSFMAGFFPPFAFGGMGQMPIDWQPISFKVDTMRNVINFDTDHSVCPAYYDVLEEQLKKPPYSSSTEEHRAILSEKSGKDLKTIWDIISLTDFIAAEMESNQPLPQWAIDEYEKVLSIIHVDFFRVIHANELMVKFKAGVLMKQIVENMVDVADGRESGKEFLIYSAHDTTVNTLAYVMGLQKQLPKRVLTGDAIMVDLTEDFNNDHKVQVNYFRSANRSTFSMEIPNCKEPCRLHEFISLVKDVMLSEEQWRKLCGLGVTRSASNRNLSDGGSIFVLVGVSMLMRIFQVL